MGTTGPWVHAARGEVPPCVSMAPALKRPVPRGARTHGATLVRVQDARLRCGLRRNPGDGDFSLTSCEPTVSIWEGHP